MVQAKEMQCNVCGKFLKIENGILKEDGIFIQKEWGYFSNKDLEVHRLCVCEKCYDNMATYFKIPVESVEKTLVFQDK